MAAWDLFARQQGRPLAAVLGGDAAGASSRACRSASRTRSTSWSSASSSNGPPVIGASRSRSSRAGTSSAVARVREACGDVPLMVDANAAYTLDGRRSPGRARSLRPDDDRAAARLRRPARPRRRCSAGCATPICLDESIHSLRAAEDALAIGACRIINIKPGRRRRARSVDSRCTTSPRGTACRCGTAACSKAGSAARTTSISRRCRISRCRATWRRAGATMRRI